MEKKQLTSEALAVCEAREPMWPSVKGVIWLINGRRRQFDLPFDSHFSSEKKPWVWDIVFDE